MALDGSNVTDVIICTYNISKNDPQATEREIQLPYIVFCICFALLGMISNLHVIIVLFGLFKDTHLTFTIYLKVLSICDFWACFGMFAKVTLEHYFCPLVNDRDVDCYLTNYLGYVSSMWSMLLVVAISYDRYLHLCKPLNVQHSTKKTWAICGISALVAAVWAAPILFLYGSKSIRVDGGVYIKECGISDSVRDTVFPHIFYICFDVVFLFLPFSVIIMYMKIRKTVMVGIENRKILERAAKNAATLHQASDLTNSEAKNQSIHERNSEPYNEDIRPPQEQVPNKQDEESTSRLTRIAIIITVLYSISYAAVLTIETVDAFSGNSIDRSRASFMASRYGFFIVFVNNVCNPFVYFFNHSQLRGGLKKMYSCILCMEMCKQDF